MFEGIVLLQAIRTEFTVDTYSLAGYTVSILVVLGVYWGIKRIIRIANYS